MRKVFRDAIVYVWVCYVDPFDFHISTPTHLRYEWKQYDAVSINLVWIKTWWIVYNCHCSSLAEKLPTMMAQMLSKINTKSFVQLLFLSPTNRQSQIVWNALARVSKIHVFATRLIVIDLNYSRAVNQNNVITLWSHTTRCTKSNQAQWDYHKLTLPRLPTLLPMRRDRQLQWNPQRLPWRKTRMSWCTVECWLIKWLDPSHWMEKKQPWFQHLFTKVSVYVLDSRANPH